MRGAVGDVKVRYLKQVGFVQNMEDAPPGRYAAVFFDTEFTRATVEEKVVFYQEGNNWRLAGYFFHKRYKAGEQTQK